MRYNNIKYQSFVYGSFVWGIHVRYNKQTYIIQYNYHGVQKRSNDSFSNALFSSESIHNVKDV